eukprot:Rhum_TRINITY_DN25036_c0_g1::Rhum_TRINITY_DN25036_c0_g1_i1::g.180832::m.180832
MASLTNGRYRSLYADEYRSAYTPRYDTIAPRSVYTSAFASNQTTAIRTPAKLATAAPAATAAPEAPAPAPTPAPAPALSPATARGFSNRPGENNCFLNVVLQALVHMDGFATGMLEEGMQEHRLSCSGTDDTCVYCATAKVLKLARSHDGAIEPGHLRRTLAHGLKGYASAFQLRAMSDATELFEALLGNLHHPKSRSDKSCADGAVTGDPCWLHKLAGIGLKKESRCACGVEDRTAPLHTYWSYVTYVLSSSLIRAKYSDIGESRINLLGATTNTHESFTCEACHSGAQRHTTIVHLPQVLCIGVVWSGRSVPQAHVERLSDFLFDKIDLRQHPHFADQREEDAYGDLIGIVAYYCMSHYISYFKSSNDAGERVWVFADDSFVKVVGPAIEDVVQHIKTGRYQPCLLFYKTRATPPTADDTRRAQISDGRLQALRWQASCTKDATSDEFARQTSALSDADLEDAMLKTAIERSKTDNFSPEHKPTSAPPAAAPISPLTSPRAKKEGAADTYTRGHAPHEQAADSYSTRAERTPAARTPVSHASTTRASPSAGTQAGQPLTSSARRDYTADRLPRTSVRVPTSCDLATERAPAAAHSPLTHASTTSAHHSTANSASPQRPFVPPLRSMPRPEVSDVLINDRLFTLGMTGPVQSPRTTRPTTTPRTQTRWATSTRARPGYY